MLSSLREVKKGEVASSVSSKGLGLVKETGDVRMRERNLRVSSKGLGLVKEDVNGDRKRGQGEQRTRIREM